jgi:hypothetical protein
LRIVEGYVFYPSTWIRSVTTFLGSLLRPRVERLVAEQVRGGSPPVARAGADHRAESRGQHVRDVDPLRLRLAYVSSTNSARRRPTCGEQKAARVRWSSAAVATNALELHELRPSPASTRRARGRLELKRKREIGKNVTWIPTCGSYYATYAKTAPETIKGCKSDSFHSSWVSNNRFCGLGLKSTQLL